MRIQKRGCLTQMQGHVRLWLIAPSCPQRPVIQAFCQPPCWLYLRSASAESCTAEVNCTLAALGLVGKKSMGSAASAYRSTAGEPSPAEIAALPPVAEKGRDLLFSVLPQNEEIKKKGAVCELEVGKSGFRLLRPNSEDSLGAFPWGQIHSWASGPNRFTFRYFDDGKRAVVLYTLYMRDIPALLKHIQSIIDDILAQRQSNVIGDESFAELKAAVASSASEDQHLALLTTAMSSSYFWAKQGRELVELMPTLFDKVEAATQLHSRLVDQNHFSVLLEVLDSPADRDNVWARITAGKKASKK